MLCYKQNFSINGTNTKVEERNPGCSEKAKKKLMKIEESQATRVKYQRNYSYWGINKRRTDTVGTQMVSYAEKIRDTKEVISAMLDKHEIVGLNLNTYISIQ